MSHLWEVQRPWLYCAMCILCLADVALSSHPLPGERGKHPGNVSGSGGREQLCPHVCCAWEASAIPAQVLAHGLKRHAIVEPLEVAGMLNGHLAALAYRDLRGWRCRGQHGELLPRPNFGTKYPW